MIVLPAFVEEFGVAAVIVAAQERTVTDPHKTVLLEDLCMRSLWARVEPRTAARPMVSKT